MYVDLLAYLLNFALQSVLLQLQLANLFRLENGTIELAFLRLVRSSVMLFV